MKKYTLFVLLLLLVSTQELFAGVSITTRSGCHWWARRYVTNAHLSTSACGLKYSWSHDGGCSWAESYVTSSWCCSSLSEAYAHNEGSWHSTYLKTYCKTCGGALSDLYASLTEADGSDPSVDLSPATQTSSFDPGFKDGVITISGIKLQLQSDPADPFVNTYTLAVWLPADDTLKGTEDTLYTEKKAINAGTIKLQYGRLSVTGTLFSASDFAVDSRGELTTVTYIGADKTIALPKPISSDNVAVSGFGDVLPDDGSIFKVAAAKSVLEGGAELVIAPNPVKDLLYLDFNMPKANTLDIMVYDALGKQVMQRPQVPVNKGSNQLNIDMSQLASGTYYLMAKGQAVKILKQVVKL